MTQSHPFGPFSAGRFLGRGDELWQIDQSFQDGTRRIVIAGPEGQGKTRLASEAAHWLVHNGRFEVAAFQGMAGFSGLDPLEYVLDNLSRAAGERLHSQAEAAQFLAARPCLLILDQIEDLASAARAELLAAAAQWSSAGESRVIITTTEAHLHHPDYPTANGITTRYLTLAGLPEDAAVRMVEQPLSERPDPRLAAALAAQLEGHPLALRVISPSLVHQGIGRVAARLRDLPDAAGPLDAALRLWWEDLPSEAQRLSPRLAVFRRGAMEDLLVGVTEMGTVFETQEEAMARRLLETIRGGDLRATARAFGVEIAADAELSELQQEELAATFNRAANLLAGQIPSHHGESAVWGDLRANLEAAGLAEVIELPGIATRYCLFHPALLRFLAPRLDAEEGATLEHRYRERYFQFSRHLALEAQQRPVEAHAAAHGELANLLRAAYAAVQARDAWAWDFVENIAVFLGAFGLVSDLNQLQAGLEHRRTDN